jgi:hypothetical protein
MVHGLVQEGRSQDLYRNISKSKYRTSFYILWDKYFMIMW